MCKSVKVDELVRDKNGQDVERGEHEIQDSRFILQELEVQQPSPHQGQQLLRHNIMTAWLGAREKVTSTRFSIHGSLLLCHVDG